MKKDAKESTTSKRDTAKGGAVVLSPDVEANGRAASMRPPLGRLKGLSLFANVGIAETYLKDVGIDIVVANEWLPERARFYQHLYPDCNMICGDITDAAIYKRIIKAARDEDVGFVMATPPCQGMSIAGKEDPHDPRNYLVTYAADAIRDLRPKFALMENVKKAA